MAWMLMKTLGPACGLFAGQNDHPGAARIDLEFPAFDKNARPDDFTGSGDAPRGCTEPIAELSAPEDRAGCRPSSRIAVVLDQSRLADVHFRLAWTGGREEGGFELKSVGPRALLFLRRKLHGSRQISQRSFTDLANTCSHRCRRDGIIARINASIRIDNSASKSIRCG